MPIPKSKKIKFQSVEQSIKFLLESLNYDLKDPDIKDTPKRMAKLLITETEPYPKEVLKKLLKTFPSTYTSMVTLINHKAFTRCPHHLERVELDISIAYIPNGRLLGLSKLPRIADYMSAGLMLQEEIAETIAEGLMNALNPLGVAVHISGRHMCMRARGVKTTHSNVITTCLKGLFYEDHKAREEFFLNISNGGK